MRDFLRKWKKHFTWAALFSLLANVLMLTFPFYMFTIYGNVLSSYSLTTLYSATVVALFALLCFGLFFFVRARLLARAGADMSKTYREKVLAGGIEDYSKVQARSYSQGVSDLDSLRGYVSSPALFALFDAPFIPLYIMVIYVFHPLLGMIATAGALIMLVLSVLQELLTRKKLREANAKNATSTRLVNSILRNSETINAMGMMKDVTSRWRVQNNEVIYNQSTASNHAGSIQAIIKPLQQSMSIFIFFVGALLVMRGILDVGLMVVSSIMMGRAVQPLMQVVFSWKQTAQAYGAFTRLNNYLLFREKTAGRTALPGPTGHLQAEGVIAVAGGSHVLNNVAFNLMPGEFMGVIGPSGAGKTTLCRVILGVLPSFRGQARLDGVEVSGWDKDELGQYIGYLPQEIELFQGSLARNISRMSDPDMEKTRKAAGLAGVHDFIMSLPDGYETIVGDDGIGFSGGQKQRLGLARALYGDPRLLILDEPNSNLDAAGEAALTQTLAGLKAGKSCTCVMVTHKPEILTIVDKILMLRQGQVAMFGPRDQVWERLFKVRSIPSQKAV